MTATPDNAAPDPQQIVAELQRRLDESRAELAARNSAYSERIAYQAAANDVLKVMSASPGDPQPIFDLIVERARDLCGGYGVTGPGSVMGGGDFVGTRLSGLSSSRNSSNLPRIVDFTLSGPRSLISVC